MEGSWRLCDKCNLYFPPNGHKHFKESEAPTEIGCKFCTETFKLSKDHIQHCNKLHVEEIFTKWFHCDLCLEYYPTVKGLKRHQKSFCKSVSEKSVRKRNSSRIKSEEMDEDGDEASSTPPRKRPPRRASARRKNYNLDDDFGDEVRYFIHQAYCQKIIALFHFQLNLKFFNLFFDYLIFSDGYQFRL